MLMFFDTETTGLLRPGSPLSSQPYVVQLAAILVGEADRVERGSFSFLIQPKGWVIPEEVSRINGVTTALATVAGVPINTALSAFTNMRAVSSHLIAHNIEFDVSMTNLELQRLNAKPAHPGPGSDRHVCTAVMAAPIVNLPPTPRMLAAGRNTPKTPKLSEAYEFLFKEPLLDAHDALVDVRACARVYFHLRDLRGY